MCYIFLDLEWNNAYSKKHKRFINEIIEIGAVKLDNNFKELDSLSILIKSQLTKKLSLRFRELTNITNEDMNSGIALTEAIYKYTKWFDCDAITLTWSNSDLYTLVDNLSCFTNLKNIPFIGKYIDLQKYVQSELRLRNALTTTNQMSLKSAAEAIGLNTDNFALHRARDDSRVCAEILKRTYHENRLNSFIQDTSNPDYYKRLTYKSYIITDIRSPHIKRGQLKIKCENCSRFAKRISKWNFKNRSFRSEFHCNHCGSDFFGQLTFKKHFDHTSRKQSIRPILKNINSE